MKAKIWNYKKWIKETDPQTLKNKFEKLLIDSGFTLKGYIEHYYQPQGWTGIWLVAESHFAIHTFPEHNKTYIELSSCSKEKNDNLLENIKAEKIG